MNEMKILFTEEEVQQKVKEVADKINLKFKDEDEILFICVLSGSFMFCADLMKHINIPCKVDFVKVASYENSVTTGIIKELYFNLPSLKDKNVILVEDIVDTGITAKYLVDKIKNEYHPKSVTFVSLFDKKCTRQIDIRPDIYGFDRDNKFILG